MIHVWSVWHPAVSTKTYTQHKDILITPPCKGYWGAIHDAHYPAQFKHVIDEHLPQLRNQIDDNKKTYLFVGALDTTTDFFRGEISKIKKGKEFKQWKENKLVPEYYKKLLEKRKDLQIEYWFLLTDIRRIDHSIFKKARPLKYGKINREKYGKAGRPYPCVCDFDEKLIKSEFIHSPDFCTINFRGEVYYLTIPQARVIKILYEAHEKGAPALSQKYILNQLIIDPNSDPDHTSDSLKDIFKSSPKAWKDLIIQVRKGIYKLPL